MVELNKEHWAQAKINNLDLILQSKIQIQMAEKIIQLCDEKIKEFEEKEPKNKPYPVKGE